MSFLSDAPALDPETSFHHAQQGFLHGFLSQVQQESAAGYIRFQGQSPFWARKFRLLQAATMISQGLYEDSLKVLSDPAFTSDALDARVERLSMTSIAFTRLHRLDEASDALASAHQLCADSLSPRCGEVLRAAGVLALERDDPDGAKTAALAALEFARHSNDGLLEGTALLDLGMAATFREHHTEAFDYFHESENSARRFGTGGVLTYALGNEGWEDFCVGNYDKALLFFEEAAKRSASVADVGGEVQWLILAARAYSATGQNSSAEGADLRAIALARKIGDRQSIINASEVLAGIYNAQGRSAEAERFADDALVLSQQTGNQPDLIECGLLQGQAASLRHDWPRAEELLQAVLTSPASMTSQKWLAQHALGRMFEAKGNRVAAQQSYESALALVEGARADLKREVSRLTFLENAASIYDDYIHLLIAEGKTDEALDAADRSRAKTLQQGLDAVSVSLSVHGARASPQPPASKLDAVEVARKSGATLLFYLLGERQSYLWAISPEKALLIPLPPKAEIVPRLERYRRSLLALKDPLRNQGGDEDDARVLYEMLVAPAAEQIAPGRPVVLLVDGQMGQLNFETLVVPSPTAHYWIEDATVLSAPSIRMFAAASHDISSRNAGSPAQDRILLLGNAVPVTSEYRALPMAALEMERVGRDFPTSATIFQGARATPSAYLTSHPEQFAYIHFVAHGTAIRTDPLESSVVLSRDRPGEDSYKLYAREILRHPIGARLVTISACNSNGTKSFAGEGMVGLSWAFLRAGAHNAIGSLWEVSDASTPELMEALYAGLHKDEPPASALRDAKLGLLHSGGRFSRPFYWAPFQLYAGR